MVRVLVMLGFFGFLWGFSAKKDGDLQLEEITFKGHACGMRVHEQKSNLLWDRVGIWVCLCFAIGLANIRGSGVNEDGNASKSSRMVVGAQHLPGRS